MTRFQDEEGTDQPTYYRGVRITLPPDIEMLLSNSLKGLANIQKSLMYGANYSGEGKKKQKSRDGDNIRHFAQPP